MNRKKYIVLLVLAFLVIMEGCAKSELEWSVSGKVDIILKEGIKVTEEAEEMKEVEEAEEVEKETEDENERIIRSETQFVEFYYGNMDLPDYALTEYTEDNSCKPYEKNDINMITDPEMAKNIALSIFEPYFEKYPEMDLTMWVQYIPSYGYYIVYARKYSNKFGYKVQVVLDEKDARVVKLWEFDGV